MPTKPKKPCAHPRCPQLVTGERYCEEHKKQRARQVDQQRGTAAERGYDARWRRARVRYLREHPLCVRCLKEKKYTAASVVDHIVPHKGDHLLFWNEMNWQPLCKPCHDKKTVTEDGGFGR